MTELSLRGKVAVVTGGASGIGRAIALCFAANGATVRVLDVNQQQAADTVAAIVAQNGVATAHACDLTSSAEVERVFREIQSLASVHILVNSAGVAHIGRLESTTEQDFDRVFAVNVKGSYLAMQAVIDGMVQQGGGVILNIASIAASAALADRFAYSASKGAVLSMTYSVARDYLDKNIRCNAISPARVHTPFVDGFLRKTYPGREQEFFDRLQRAQPIGRMAQPEEVAHLALYLCSDLAGFITGVDYPLDGGFFNLRG